MHLYLASRGPKHIRDLWVTHMQAQPGTWVRKNLKTGEDEKTLINWTLKPIELWELTFPQEQLNEVLYYLRIKGSKQVHDDRLKHLASVFKMGLKLDKIPDYKPEEVQGWPRLLHAVSDGMSIYGLGIKKDDYKAFPQWGYMQEGI